MIKIRDILNVVETPKKSILAFPKNTEVDFEGRVSCYCSGKCYKLLFRICNSDDAVLVHCTRINNKRSEIFYNYAEVIRDYFSVDELTKYQEAAKENCLPLDICLAVTYDLAEEFSYLTGALCGPESKQCIIVPDYPYMVSPEEIEKLENAKSQREKKAAVLSLLPDASASLQNRIRRIGKDKINKTIDYMLSIIR